MHKPWCGTEKVPCCFSRSSIQFQGHTGRKIEDLNRIWVRLLGRSQLLYPSDLPCLYIECAEYIFILQVSIILIIGIFGLHDLPRTMPSFDRVPEVDSLLSCAICLNPFTQPKLLQCGHSFCLVCLEKLLPEDNTSISCPTCKFATPKPEEGLPGLKDDFRLNQIKDGIQAAVKRTKKESEIKSNTSVVCSACWSLAKVRCLQCHQAMCQECLNKHNTRKDIFHHTILKVEDVLACDDHGKDRSYVCHDCKRFVCTTCMIDKCSEHACKEIGEAVRNFIASGQLKRNRDESLSTLASSAATEKEIWERFASVKEEIQKHADDISSAIKIQSGELIDNLKTIKQDALHDLESSRRSASEQRLKLDSLVYNKPEDLQCGIPTELLMAVLKGGIPGMEEGRQNRFLEINFKVNQEPNKIRLGELEFSDTKELVSLQTNVYRKITPLIGLLSLSVKANRVMPKVRQYGQSVLSCIRPFIRQFGLGVICFFLFCYSEFYFISQRSEWSVWQYLGSIALGILMCVMFYFIYCHFLHETRLAIVDRTSGRIGKWVAFTWTFCTVNFFIYMCIQSIQEEAGKRQDLPHVEEGTRWHHNGDGEF